MVPHIHGHDGCLVVFMHDEAQAIGQGEFFVRNINGIEDVGGIVGLGRKERWGKEKGKKEKKEQGEPLHSLCVFGEQIFSAKRRRRSCSASRKDKTLDEWLDLAGEMTVKGWENIY